MTLRGGNSQACAACKYQRRKCYPECPLARYFRPDRPKIFENAHKLFGVRNILKILKKLDPRQKDEAMNSIIYQANIREMFPVHGCWGVICKLEYQIQLVEEELYGVLTQLEIHRQQQDHHLKLGMALPSAVTNINDSQDKNEDSNNNHDALCLFEEKSTPPPLAIVAPGRQYCFSFHSSSNCDDHANMDTKLPMVENHLSSNSCLWLQQYPYGSANGTHSMPTIKSQTIPHPGGLQPLAFQQQQQHLDHLQHEHYNDDHMQNFFDTIDERESYIELKDAYDPRYHFHHPFSFFQFLLLNLV